MSAAPSTQGPVRATPSSARRCRGSSGRPASRAAPASGYAMRGLQGRVINARRAARSSAGGSRPVSVLPNGGRADRGARGEPHARSARRCACSRRRAWSTSGGRSAPASGSPSSGTSSMPTSCGGTASRGSATGSCVDLVETRQLLEPAAARLAAARATMDDLRPHGAAPSRRWPIATGDLEGYAHADVEFHLAVYAASHNLLLRQFGTVVADLLHLTFNLQQVVATDDRRAGGGRRAPRRRASAAIDRGNGEAAAEAMLTSSSTASAPCSPSARGRRATRTGRRA